MYLTIKNFLVTGHARSINAKKNILASLLIKGGSIAVSLALVPLTIDYVNPSRYGIWLTLSSIVAWFSFFDVGLTNGLKNKFAEAKAKGEDDTAQVYVSTTYAILGIVFSGVWLVFMVTNQYLDWSAMLNLPKEMSAEVSILAIIVFTYFCLQFILRILSSVLVADQQSARSALIDALGQLMCLVLIFILMRVTRGSLINLGLALCASPILVLIVANFVLFNGKYKRFKPSFSKINFRFAKGLFNLGLIFFVIQVAGIIQYESANVIIARNFKLADVTSYNIVYKYFGMLNMVVTIFLVPFWSGSTEAYLKKDIQWIKNGMKRYNQLNLLLIGVGVLMLIFSSPVYELWLGKGKVNIEFMLSLWGFLFFNLSIFCGKYVTFLNGISALRIQFWACIVSPFIYVAVAMVLINMYHMGVYALFIAAVVASFNGYILAPLQYYMIISKNKKGIWLK
ncbi:MAG TPA: MATE family efflux transporter [Pedobacter sp.]|uniref:MATE family efflux transporter n=1 Tax=Pedobacter sp. TaxID=1411316 RepID=UPI002CEC69FE|nr:MATE family efflux transporter [Pedobacter sp.]HMI01443.1 MATE family efflux transporter [Pedobacter sp.]